MLKIEMIITGRILDERDIERDSDAPISDVANGGTAMTRDAVPAAEFAEANEIEPLDATPLMVNDSVVVLAESKNEDTSTNIVRFPPLA